MIFDGFLVAVAIVIAVCAIRSPIVRQLARGHGKSRPPHLSSNDHGIARKYGQDPLAHSRFREREDRGRHPGGSARR